MEKSKITSKGQITIPKSVRDELNIDSGSTVVFNTKDNYALMYKEGAKVNVVSSNQPVSNDDTIALFKKMMNFLDNQSRVKQDKPESSSLPLHHRKNDVYYENNQWFFDEGFANIFDNYAGAASILEYHDGEFRIIKSNKKFFSVLNFDQHNVTNKHWSSNIKHYISIESQDSFFNSINRAIYDQTHEVDVVLRLNKFGDNKIPFEVNATVKYLNSHANHYLLYIKLARFDHYSLETKTVLSQNAEVLSYESMFNHMPCGVLLVDVNKTDDTSTINWLNDYLAKSLRIEKNSLISESIDKFYDYTDMEYRNRIIDFVNKIIHGEQKDPIEFRVIDEEKHFHWFNTGYYYQMKDGKFLLYLFLLDITNYKEAEEKYMHLATFDPLSGILNRSAVLSRINEALSIPHSDDEYVVFMVDVDLFKRINDTYGHNTGDVIISNVASVLESNSGDSAITGRIGGDEFVIFGKKERSMEKIIEDIHKIENDLKKIKLKMHLDVDITLSWGIYSIKSTDNSFYTFFEKVDHAMYQAKNNKTLYSICED